MALVRGRETFTFMELAQEHSSSTWGSPVTPYPGSPAGQPLAWVTVPLISEDLNIERDPLPDTEEISSLGAREALESGRLIVVGSVTIRPRWDARWFHMLMSSLGTENVYPNAWVDNRSSPVTASTNAHAYVMSQTVPAGFNIRVTKAGPSADATSFTFRGCIVTEMNWEQPNDNHPQVTFTFVGKDMATAPAVPNTSVAAGSVVSKLRDLDQYKDATSPYYASRLIYRPLGATSTYVDLANVTTFTVNLNRGIDFDDPDVNTPDTVSKPGPQSQREVTLDIEGKYEQLSPAEPHPYHDFMNDNITGWSVLYSSATKTEGSTPYAFSIVIPRLVWTAGAANIDTGGTITYTASGTAVAATDVDANTLAPINANSPATTFFASPDTIDNPEAYFIGAVKTTDEFTADTAYGPGTGVVVSP